MSITNPKIFIVQRSDLEGRFDPKYIEPTRLSFYKKLKASKNIIRLKQIISEGSYGILPPGDSYDNSLPVKFIRATELKEDLQVDFEKVNYVEEKYYIKRATLKKYDILLAVKGATIAGNKCVSIILEDQGKCIVNGSIFRFQVISSALPLYVAYILNSDLLKRQMKYNLVANNAVDYLDKSLINNLLLPLPNISEQKAVVKIYQSAYNQKKQKAAQAKELLASIDTYILQELGITLPEKTVGIASRIFTVNFSEIAGVRIDPEYTSKYEFIVNQKANYKFVSFKTLLDRSPQYGANEEAKEVTSPNDIRYIRITDIDENGKLKKTKWKTAANTDDRYLLNKDDLLFARSGSVGRCYIHKEIDKEAIFAGYLIRFVINSQALPDFIFHYCNSSIYKFWVSAIERAAVQSNINAEEFKSLPIPLPPLTKQTEMLKHINDIHKQINKLQTEATKGLEDAKKEVEQIILG